MTVTLVTRDATLDTLSAGDYQDIFTELRQNLSLDKFLAVTSSQYSKATWSKYERRELELNRTMRNSLRMAVGLPPLPETVTEAVANRTSPDAAVWLVGDGTAQHVILVGAHDDGVTLHVNGEVTEAHAAHWLVNAFDTCVANPPVTEAHSVPCNRGYTASTPRKALIRPVASIEQNGRRVALLASWKDVIEAGLQAMEKEGNHDAE